MRRIKAILLILVIISMCLQGCSKDVKKQDTNKRTGGSGDESQVNNVEQTSADAVMGRYVEKKVDLPELSKSETVIKILQNTEQQIEVYTMLQNNTVCEYYSYLLKKDNTWEKNKPGWLNGGILSSNNAVVLDLCVGEDGNYYAVYTDYSVGTATVIKSEDGGNTSKKLDIPYLEGTAFDDGTNKYHPVIDKMDVLKNGNLILHDVWDNSSLIVFSPEGEKLDIIATKEDNAGAVFIASGENIIVAHESKNGIKIYNTTSKKEERTIDYDMKNGAVAYTLQADGTLLLGDLDGIHRQSKNGTLWETVVEGALNSMSMPSLQIVSLYVIEGKQPEYYVSYKDESGKFSLMKYVFDKNIKGMPENEITVYSLRENKTIRQAISLYHSEHTDTLINYVVAMGSEDGNIADYIKALNAELLAGNGADILILDGLPVDSYIEKGVLEDISDIINPLKQEGKLFTNITDNYQSETKIYSLPLRFTIPMILGDKAAVSSVGSLQNIVDYISDSKATFSASDTCRSLLEDYLSLYSKDIFKNKEILEDHLTQFLMNVKVISDNIQAAKQEEKDPLNVSLDLGYDSLNGNLFNGNIFSVSDGNASSFMQIHDIMDTSLLFAVANKYEKEYSSINQLFIPQGLVGLNSASKEKDVARSFITSLFQQEVQNANLRDGFPVNTVSLQKWIEEDNDMISFSVGDKNGNRVDTGWPTKEERKAVYNIATNLKTPIETNQVLNDMIIEEALPYLQGEADLNQVVSNLKSKVNTYLAE